MKDARQAGVKKGWIELGGSAIDLVDCWSSIGKNCLAERERAQEVLLARERHCRWRSSQELRSQCRVKRLDLHIRPALVFCFLLPRDESKGLSWRVVVYSAEAAQSLDAAFSCLSVERHRWCVAPAARVRAPSAANPGAPDAYEEHRIHMPRIVVSSSSRRGSARENRESVTQSF